MKSISFAGEPYVKPLFFGVIFLLLFSLAEELPAAVYRQVVFENGVSIKAEVADTPALRERGLMFREKLPEGTGMLFLFSEVAPHRFWMKNVTIPLDMIWLDANKRIIYILNSVPPVWLLPVLIMAQTDSLPFS